MAKLGFWSFVRAQFQTLPPVPNVDLSGKTVVVIGANGGLGFEAAKHLAKMNPGRLILGCRDSEKSRTALAKLTKDTGFKRAELWPIDLASFDSVRAFADRVEKETERLDILLENASIGQFFYSQTTDGWETSLQVNCISPALLAILLLPRMIETQRKFNATPRLTIVSSGLHMSAKINKKILYSGKFLKTFTSQDYCKKRVVQQRYNDTKLLEIYFANSLTSRLGKQRGTPIINTLDPGFCKSDLRRDTSALGSVISGIIRLFEVLFAMETEEGSRTLVYAATSGASDDREMRGAYWSYCKIAEAGDNVLGPEGEKAREAYWGELIPLLEEIDPRVKPIVAEHLLSSSK